MDPSAVEIREQFEQLAAHELELKRELAEVVAQRNELVSVARAGNAATWRWLAGKLEMTEEGLRQAQRSRKVAS